MFTKHIKTIAIVAAVLVVAVLVSCLIAVNNDKKAAEQLAGQMQQNATNTQAQIDELNKTIQALNTTLADVEKGLADAEDVANAQAEVIEALKGAGIKIENWNESTAVIVEKIRIINEIADTFTSQYDESEVLSFQDVYNVEMAYEILYDAANESLYELLRSTNVEEMDAIIASYQTVVNAIPTRLDILYSDIETVKANGVTYEDKDAIDALYEDFYALNGNVFAPAVSGELGEKEVLYNTLNTVYFAWRETVVDKFIAAVETLPTYYAIVEADYDVIQAVGVSFDEIAEAYGDDTTGYQTLLETERVATAVKTLADAEKRYECILVIKANAESVNALINPEYKIKASAESYEYVKSLEAAVINWTLGRNANEPFGAEIYTVESNPESEKYNETIWNYVNHEAIAAAKKMYTNAVAKLADDFKLFIDAIDAIGEVTVDSKEALDAALDAYLTCLAGVDADVDMFDKFVDAEEGKGLNYYYAKYHELKVVYDELLVKEAEKNVYVEFINDKLHTLLDCREEPVLDENGQPTGEITHVCGNLRKDVTHDDIAAIEALFVELRAKYGLDLTVLDSDHVALYVEARLIPVKRDAIAKINTALLAYVGNEKYAELEASAQTQIAAVNNVSHSGYEYWVYIKSEVEGESGVWCKAKDEAAELITHYASDEFIRAQFGTILEK